jgi:hypothetical protein
MIALSMAIYRSIIITLFFSWGFYLCAFKGWSLWTIPLSAFLSMIFIGGV